MARGNPTAPAIAATLYQLGRVAMMQELDIDALRYFRDALTICQLNESKGNKGETARVQWWMSQFMKLQGMCQTKQRKVPGTAWLESCIVRESQNEPLLRVPCAPHEIDISGFK